MSSVRFAQTPMHNKEQHHKDHIICRMSLIIKTKLYRHLFLTHNNLLRDVFSVFLLHNSDNDPTLKTVFMAAMRSRCGHYIFAL